MDDAHLRRKRTASSNPLKVEQKIIILRALERKGQPAVKEREVHYIASSNRVPSQPDAGNQPRIIPDTTRLRGPVCWTPTQIRRTA